MKTVVKALFLLIAAIASAQSVSGQLNNGSFETSDFTPIDFNAVFTAETDGWVSTTDSRFAVVSNAVGDILPTQGSKMLAFNQGNQTPQGSIFQTINLTPNTVYKLSFDILNVAGGLNVGNGHFMGYNAVGLRADIWQDAIVTHSLSYYPQIVGQWYAQELEFTPTNSSVTISFTDISTETFSIDVTLDNVQVVPEPSTYGLLLLSGAGSLWFIKRRRR